MQGGSTISHVGVLELRFYHALNFIVVLESQVLLLGTDKSFKNTIFIEKFVAEE